MALSFTSVEFIAFLGLCLSLVFATRSVSAQKWILLIVSYIFYLSCGVMGVLVLTSIALVDFNASRRLGTSTSTGSQKHWLWISLAANLGMLTVFKYSAFCADIVAGPLRLLSVQISAPGHIVLPIGLSYFTFASMSYVLDTYYGRIEPVHSMSEYLRYLVYFPKLVAGPIVRAGDLLPQFRRRIQFSAEDFETGCAYLLVGAVKKLVIADQLAGHVTMILAAPQQYDAFTLIQGMVGYTVKIYVDFSGYSDMAIGCARLMGIRFPQNFLMPYSSVNIVEFWRRWHVTMSSWFRDYVFLPLELERRGTRNANIRASGNIILTMLLCGLWHGANWNFVLWGGLHGVALAICQVYSSVRPRQAHARTHSGFHIGTLAARGLTLSVVMVGWIVFGSPSLTSAFQYLWRIATWRRVGVALGSPYILPLTALVLLAHLFIDKDRNLVEELPSYSVPARVFTYATLLLVITSLVPSAAVPFVYVQF